MPEVDVTRTSNNVRSTRRKYDKTVKLFDRVVYEDDESGKRTIRAYAGDDEFIAKVEKADTDEMAYQTAIAIMMM